VVELDRRNGSTAWNDYTPYEMRTIGTFVRLGWRARAHELISFFMADRRPQTWNQWAEVVGRNYREPRFIGDMPHGWVASDFIRSVLDLFAYERDSDSAIVLARGIPPSWLEGRGVSMRDLRTPYGKLTYSMSRKGRSTTLRIEAGPRVPPGGFVLVADGKPLPKASINGKAAAWRGTELRINELPATVVVTGP